MPRRSRTESARGRLAAVLAAGLMLALATKAFANWEVIQRTIPGTFSAYSFGHLSRGAGIERFDFEYVDRDHFVRNLTFGPYPFAGGPPADRDFLASMTGKFGQQYFRGSFGLRDFSSAFVEHREASRRCIGVDCAIPIPTVGPDRVLVLTGFNLDYGPGNDHQISVVKVAPQLVGGEIRGIRVGFGYHTGTIAFDAHVTYMTLPWELFSRVPPGDPAFRSPYRRWTNTRFSYAANGTRPYGAALLFGFELRFLNGVQNLLAMSIDLRSAANGTGNVAVRYTGNWPGQPASAIVDYALYQPRIL